MQYQDIADYIHVARDTLDLFKLAYNLLPSGPNKSELDSKIKRAEELIRRSDAKLAKDLGYTLCECQWPPNIMLWKESAKARVCPNPNCGRVEKESFPIPFAGGSSPSE